MGPHGSHRDRIKQLELRLAALEQHVARAPGREAVAGTPRIVRLAQTKALNGESYPTSGDELPIRFVSSAGSHSSVQPRSVDGVTTVKNLSGEWLPEETRIFVFEYCGLWWSDTGYSVAQWVIGTLDAELALDDDTVTVNVTDHGGGADPGATITAVNPASGITADNLFAGPEGATCMALRFGATWILLWVECEE